MLENGPTQSLSQAWILQALYGKWKKMKGYDKLDPKENEGQSLGEFYNPSMKSEFFKKQKSVE